VTEFNDGSQYRVVTDPGRYLRERDMFETRVSSAKGGTRLYVDTAFERHRRELGPHLRALLLYHFPYQNAGSPEHQANWFCDVLRELRPNEMVMLDTEHASGLRDPADFMRRWCGVVERRLNTLSWVYVPRDLSRPLNRDVTGARLVKAPRYSGHAGKGKPPDWPHDIWQYTDRGYFPGCPQSGDCNYTPLTVQQMLDRCRRGSAPVTDDSRRRRAVVLANQED
jgi:GH25 family lysozyme M1 (1,4-beta-N-acetylmuramidase)